MFGFSEVLCDFQGESRQQILNALYLLRQKGILFSPYRAFYVILPPQYRLIGFVPPSYYMDYLMKLLGKSYYFGLLSAAVFHGAAHQRPMSDVVMTEHLGFSERRCPISGPDNVALGRQHSPPYFNASTAESRKGDERVSMN